MNDDYLNDGSLTVDKKTAQKIIEGQTKEIGEWMQFQKILYDDYRLAKQVCATQPEVPFLRRIQIRNFCALVEAQIHVWKLLSQKFHLMNRAELAVGEISILKEEAYELNDKGNVQTKRLKLPMAKNFIFASRIFAKVFCCSHRIDFTKKGWICVKEVFEARDRLMHPKFVTGVMVEDKEIELLGLAEQWFVKEVKALFDSQADYKEICKIRKKTAPLN